MNKLTEFAVVMKGITKQFPGVVALDGVTLQVRRGEVHAICGENGAGKSTLMKVLSGAHLPDSGILELDGKLFTPSDPLYARNSGIAMIYQELNLAPELSVEENILLGREPESLGWLNFKERRRLAKNALEEIGQPDLPMDVPVHSLTIAQQQLVEIARAVVGEPRVLIMDEPTSALDPKIEGEIIENLLNYSGNKAIIMVTHKYDILKNFDTVYKLENKVFTIVN